MCSDVKFDELDLKRLTKLRDIYNESHKIFQNLLIKYTELCNICSVVIESWINETDLDFQLDKLFEFLENNNEISIKEGEGKKATEVGSTEDK